MTATATGRSNEASSKLAKAKLVRDSFTFPETDYSLISEIKARALRNGVEIKKSEILRGGLIALAAMSENQLLAALAQVDRIKAGRPKG